MGKFAGPARRLARDGKTDELRKLLAFAEQLCATPQERRTLARVRWRAAWWTLVGGQWGCWTPRH